MPSFLPALQKREPLISERHEGIRDASRIELEANGQKRRGFGGKGMASRASAGTLSARNSSPRALDVELLLPVRHSSMFSNRAEVLQEHSDLLSAVLPVGLHIAVEVAIEEALEDTCCAHPC